MKATDMELGWLAGIVDGEGHIGLYRATPTKTSKAIRPILQIVNTDIRIIEACRRIIVDIIGKPINVSVLEKKTHQKDVYRLAVGSQKDLLILLPTISRFLVGKREQADNVVSFCAGRGKRQIRPFAEDESLYSRCRELNRRGVKEHTALNAPATVQ